VIHGVFSFLGRVVGVFARGIAFEGAWYVLQTPEDLETPLPVEKPVKALNFDKRRVGQAVTTTAAQQFCSQVDMVPFVVAGMIMLDLATIGRAVDDQHQFWWRRVIIDVTDKVGIGERESRCLATRIARVWIRGKFELLWSPVVHQVVAASFEEVVSFEFCIQPVAFRIIATATQVIINFI